jgi:hypothetical protein
MSIDAPGLFIPPLSADRIQAALEFGRLQYSSLAQAESDPYDVFVPEVSVLVSIGTAFGRIAAYAGQVARTGAQIDLSVVESINFMPHFKSHFNVRLISKHKRLSIMATDIGNGMPQQMEQATVEKNGNGTYSQTCLFPNPATAKGEKGFEIGVPHFVPLKFKTEFKTAQFVFNFAQVH